MNPQTRMYLTKTKRNKGKLEKQLSLFSSGVQTQCIIKGNQPDHQERNCQCHKNIKIIATLLTNKEVVRVKVMEVKAQQSQTCSKVNHLINLEHTQ